MNQEPTRPRSARNLLPLGTGDGTWCLCPDSLDETSVVYSFGVGRDVSFDRALIERFGAEVHAFDPTPLSVQWIQRQVMPPQFHFHAYGLAGYDGTALFSLPETHVVSFTMLDLARGRMTVPGSVHRLPTILELLGHKRVHVVKLDIEGAEYSVIPDLIACSTRIDQLLIEFHDRCLNGPNPYSQTTKAIETLEASGFSLFHVSNRGLEYSFIRAPE